MKRRVAWLSWWIVFTLAASGGAEDKVSREALGPQIIHLPTLERRAEQGILRPVPISAELPEDIALRARRVLLHYRLWGEPDWTTLQLRTNGARYEGAIPCLEVSTVTGDLRYYIRVHDAEGQVVASAGSRAKPYVVTIRHDTMLGSDAKRVAKCPDPADCPRGLPGCPSEQVEVSCLSDRDCEGGLTCGWHGICERGGRQRTLFSISAQQDFGLFRGTAACSIYAQENEGYACYRDDGQQYMGSPIVTNEPLAVGPGPTRVVVGIDQVVYYDTTIGARVGWAVRGAGPTPRGAAEFFPLSVALRGTHWFGSDLFARRGWRPFAFVTGGYATFDIHGTVHVRENSAVSSRQGGNSLEQQLEVWKRAGDGFVGLGGGAAFAFDRHVTAFAEIGLLYVFPFDAAVVASSLGAQFAF
jgi:hypothetical protein